MKDVSFDYNAIATPCYVVDKGKIKQNLEILEHIQKKTGCKILLALKGFAMFSLFPLIGHYLAGVSASSLDEARLASEEFGKEVHVYSPAFLPDGFAEIVGYADHLIFNSFSQWELYKDQVLHAPGKISCGIRINPQHSDVAVDLYNPCGRYSRLGVTQDQFKPDQLDGIEGLHFHALCEQNSDSLANTLAAVEKRFGQYLHSMKWFNFGGGHHITRPDYDRDRLCTLINDFKERYGVEVYLEPGEAIALGTGCLVAQVLDIVHNEIDIAILDTSAAAHMPDVLEMPYRPEVVGGGGPGEFHYTYRLGGLTCLAGDVIGDYSFREPLQVGQKVVFQDMAHYTMVKNNTFNGVRLPSIAIYHPEADAVEIVRKFGYEEYRNRLS
jgi:carboxynorspermidine decarboxylase